MDDIFPHKDKSTDVQKIVERDVEISRVIDVLFRMRRNSALMVGNAGSGRTSLIQALNTHLKNEKLFHETKKLRIVTVNIFSFLTEGYSFNEMLNRILMKDENLKTTPVLAIDSLDELRKVECSVRLKIFNWIKEQLTARKLQLILVCDVDFYQVYLQPESDFLQYCEPVYIRVPSFEQATNMVKAHLNDIKQVYHVNISKEVASSIVVMAHRYMRDVALPSSALNLLDAVAAKISSCRQHARIRKRDIANLLAAWVDIDPVCVEESDEEKVEHLADSLSQEIYGQPTALGEIQETLGKGVLKLNEVKPLAMMLFAGPSHVGKVSTAYAIAEIFFGTKRHVIRFDLAEYDQPDDLNRLLGSEKHPGDLFIELRKMPCAICLLENIEKAHLRVVIPLLETLKNTTDCDLSNIIVILTMDMAVKSLDSATVIKNESISTQTERLLQFIEDDLPGRVSDTFRAQPLLRSEISLPFSEVLSSKVPSSVFENIVFVPFGVLSRDDLVKIFIKKLNTLRKDLKEKLKVELKYSEDLASHLASRFDIRQEEMNVYFSKKVISVVSNFLLHNGKQSKKIKSIRLQMREGGQISVEAVKTL